MLASHRVIQIVDALLECMASRNLHYMLEGMTVTHSLILTINLIV